MTVPAETEADIRRLFFAEHWPVGTIAAQLGVHADVVRRVVGLLAEQRQPPPRQESPLVVYEGFLRETLEKYPDLLAPRLADMIRERGYAGSVRTVREWVAHERPRRSRRTFVRVETLPGEQAQIDWMCVGKVRVDGGMRVLWCFAMALAWSRALFAELVFEQNAASLARSLVRACTYFRGTTREWLFDNPKPVVIDRVAGAVRFHDSLVAIASKFNAEPRVCGVRRPQSKGKVERLNRFMRDRFFAGRDLSDPGLRPALAKFLATIALDRPHPRLAGRTVRDCLDEERGLLLPLPDPLPETWQIASTDSRSTARVSFGGNTYSVPPENASKIITIRADDTRVDLLDGSDVVASHVRSWGRGHEVAHPEHLRALIERSAAQPSKGRDLLRLQLPRFDELAAAWVRTHRNVGNGTARVLRLLDRHGAPLVSDAVTSLLSRGLCDLGHLEHVCEQLRRERHRPLLPDVHLSPSVPDRDVLPHDPGAYDD